MVGRAEDSNAFLHVDALGIVWIKCSEDVVDVAAHFVLVAVWEVRVGVLEDTLHLGPEYDNRDIRLIWE